MIKMPKATCRKQGILLLICWGILGGRWLYDYLTQIQAHAVWWFVFEIAASIYMITYAIRLICRKPEPEEKKTETNEE